MEKGLVSEKEKKLHRCITCRKWHTAYMMMQLCDYRKIKECIKCFNRKEQNGK